MGGGCGRGCGGGGGGAVDGKLGDQILNDSPLNFDYLFHHLL